MYCGNCGKNCEDNKFCPFCGEAVGVKQKKKSAGAKIIVIIFVVIIAVLSGVLTVLLVTGGEEESTSGKSEIDYTMDINKNDTVTTLSEEKSTTVSAEPAFDPGKLFRPDESCFCDQYRRYISGNFEGQGYAKMRFGPSKSKYNVVGQIDNGNIVTVQTLSVDGWTLIYYEGKEGWVRTDFLFETYEDCFYKPDVKPDVELCGFSALVDVTGEYDGEPLNMRGGPSREYELITHVPDGAVVEVWGQASDEPGWIYVSYNGFYGWVLEKYLILDAVGDKPVLYLYPETETDVTVKVSLSDKMFFTCTYPPYEEYWSVRAFPDGSLINYADGREYSYLYWELGGQQNFDFSEGFVVKGSDTMSFLQETLADMGLTPREYNEFIVYWLPLMQNNPYNLISFQTEEYTDNVRLEINPEPDSVLRVFMAFRALDEYTEVPAPEIVPFERNGFTVVEWGGAEVK